MRFKRFLAALLAVLALAVMVERTMTTANSPVCATITPDDWFLWWLYDCGKDAGGGGGSGAGD